MIVYLLFSILIIIILYYYFTAYDYYHVFPSCLTLRNARNDNLFYLLLATYLCFILLLNVLIILCEICFVIMHIANTPTLFLAFLG